MDGEDSGTESNENCQTGRDEHESEKLFSPNKRNAMTERGETHGLRRRGNSGGKDNK